MKTVTVLLFVLWSGSAQLAFSQQASSAPPDLNGTWTTADGTMVKVTQRGASIEARSLVPNRQMASLFGWKSGDIVFQGKLADGTISGQIAYRFSVTAGQACPGKAMIMLDLEMQVLGADQLMGKTQHRILGRDCSLSDGPWGALEFTRRSFDVKETASEINVQIRDGILFDLDRSDLKADALVVLRELKQLVLDEQPFVRILIEGHTDSQGSDAYNITLSLQRANAVSRWLVESGVPQSRLDAKGFGRARPLLPNSTAANRAQNRRVEIKVIKPTGAL
jgi:outer membrane protein OmpA-like peptidoglycan-associated protein